MYVSLFDRRLFVDRWIFHFFWLCVLYSSLVIQSISHSLSVRFVHVLQPFCTIDPNVVQVRVFSVFCLRGHLGEL